MEDVSPTSKSQDFESPTTKQHRELPDRNPHAQDALQTHRRNPKEDRTGMPPTLPPALLWQQAPSTELLRDLLRL
ncbi:MAG: hypothetical protein Q9193_007216, partial [Seirophora villosa]